MPPQSCAQVTLPQKKKGGGGGVYNNKRQLYIPFSLVKREGDQNTPLQHNNLPFHFV